MLRLIFFYDIQAQIEIGNQHIYIKYLNNSNKHLIHSFMNFKMTDGYSIR
jgi:hypothetical protein